MRRVIWMCCLALSGCAAFANSRATADLQRGYTSAAQRAALAEVSVEDLEARLAGLEARLREQGLDGTGTLTSASELQEEVARVKGTLEEIRYTVDGLQADFHGYQVDQERRQLHDEARLRQIEELLKVAPPPPPSVGGGAVEQPPVTGGSPEVPPGSGDAVGEPEGLDVAARLAVAEERMADGQQAAARVILEGILTAAPDDPMVPEVRYRLAETLFNDGEFREAARAFQVITDKHPKSSWAPWAMFRIGECFDGMGRSDAAGTFYEGVVRNFPGTDAARAAAERHPGK